MKSVLISNPEGGCRMTLNEAKTILECCKTDSIRNDKIEALDIAIEALEKQIPKNQTCEIVIVKRCFSFFRKMWTKFVGVMRIEN